MERWRIQTSLVEFMRSITYREFRTRVAWLEMDLNRPGKQEGYLMQIAREVRSVLAKNPASIRLDHFKNPMTFSLRRKQQRMTPEETMRRSKAAWLGMFRGKVERRITHE